MIKFAEEKIAPLLSGGPIFWAVDPFDQQPPRQVPLWKTAAAFNEEDRQIRPIAVVSPRDLSWSFEFSPDLQERVCKMTQASLGQVFGAFDEVARPTVLIEATPSHRNAAKTLARYAFEHEGKMIAVNCHGRRGFQRFRLGSFTEALLTVSRVPVLVMGPQAHPSERIRKVLFPTDFSKESERLFKRLSEWIASQEGELTLYHVEAQVPRLATETDPYWITQIWERDQAEVRALSRQWLDEARKKGAVCRLITESDDLANLGRRVLHAQRDQNCDLIVMGIQGAPAERLFFGGNTREIISEATCPVLALRSQ